MEKLVMKSANRPILDIQETPYFKVSNDYQQDFLYVTELVKDVFPYYDRYFEGDFKAEVKRIYERLETIKKEYIFDYEVKQFLARLHNNHTYLITENDNIYPIYLRLFDGDLVIINAGQHLDSTMIGQHIKTINGKSAADWIQHSIDITHGETPFQDSLSAEYAFLAPDFYRFYGKDTETLTVQTQNGDEFRIQQKEVGDFKWYRWRREMNDIYRMTRQDHKGYDYEILYDDKLAYFQFNTFMDKTTMLDGIGTYIRRPYRGLVRAYVRQQYGRRTKGKSATGFIRAGTEDVKVFLDTMFQRINQGNIETLVIDLRHNGGGDLDIGKYIIRYLTDNEQLIGYGEGLKLSANTRSIFTDLANRLDSLHLAKTEQKASDGVLTEEQFDAKRDFYHSQNDPNSIYYLPPQKNIFSGKVYIISGAQTGSAASMFTVMMKDNQLAEIVGVPPANLPTGPTVVIPLQLPNTKRRISVSTHFMTRPDSTKHNDNYLEIDHYTPITETDFFDGRDAAMEWILKAVREKDKSVEEQLN
ncbi:MAG: S41 family peptidase [Bacteroidota bacterium]